MLDRRGGSITKQLKSIDASQMLAKVGHNVKVLSYKLDRIVTSGFAHFINLKTTSYESVKLEETH